MKKDKNLLIITIGIMFMILTAVIFIQFKTINQTDIKTLELMREEELRQEIASIKTKYEETAKKIQETSDTITEYEQIILTGQQASEVLAKELKQSSDLLGKNDVTGPGVAITLIDGRNARISAYDILVLLNELKAAGAEAISINEQRVIFNTYVVDINSGFIMVNEERIVSPYVVKAIGDPIYLESGLSKKQYGYIDQKILEGKNVTLERQEDIEIYKYEDNLKFEYIKEEE